MPAQNVIIGVLLVLSILGVVRTEWKAIEDACKCQEFRCDEGRICLHAQRVCDGSKDCPGGEDEKNKFMVRGKCQRRKMKCGPNEFPCKFGDCIELTRVCDGVIDCWGAVDESSDFCTWVHSNSTE